MGLQAEIQIATGKQGQDHKMLPCANTRIKLLCSLGATLSCLLHVSSVGSTPCRDNPNAMQFVFSAST